MTNSTSSLHSQIDSWCNDDSTIVALRLRQRLIPVEGEDAVFFPPTYAGIGYNIDTLSDGTKTVIVDSVGSQGNRMEPLFKQAPNGKNPLAALVPQIDIVYDDNKRVSILDVSHRLGDAFLRSTELADEAAEAFDAFLDRGNATAIAKLAPTSLIFGVWDSRKSGAKLPRILQSTIRAWKVDKLTRSAQFFPAVVNPKDLKAFDETDLQKLDGQKNPLAKAGFASTPSTNDPGGVIARGGIERITTVNLIALRRLSGDDTPRLRRYVLGLALAAATAPPEVFLRQGCLLVNDPQNPACWETVERSGSTAVVDITHEPILEYTEAIARDFGVAEERTVKFDPKRAKQVVKEAKKTSEESKE